MSDSRDVGEGTNRWGSRDVVRGERGGLAPGSTVGILGDDALARSLGAGFLERGWKVMLGTRSPGRLSEWQHSVAGEPDVGSFADTAQYGDVVVLAVDPDAALSVIDRVGPEQFDDTLVVDATDPPETATEPLETAVVASRHRFDQSVSLAEEIQGRLPDASVVKCFNGVPPDQVVDPEFDGDPPRPLLCGDDPIAKDRIAGILVAFGWPGARDLGDLTAARYVEALVAVQERPAVEWTTS